MTENGVPVHTVRRLGGGTDVLHVAGRAAAKQDRMSPIISPCFLASIAAFAFATCADAAPAHTRHATKPAASHTHPENGGTARESAEDLHARGVFAMMVGQSAEAIAAFERVVGLRAASTDTWGKLAFLYLKEGDTAKAVAAFKKAKHLGDANCGIVSRDASGGLQFP